MQSSRAYFALAFIICSSEAHAAESPPQRDAVALALQAPHLNGVEFVPSVPLPVTKQFRGFFGYLEFDFDPDVPGGVPGFSDTLEQSAGTEVRRD